VLRGQREHYSKDCENQRKDKEEGSGGDGSMMMMPFTVGTVSISVRVMVGGGRLGHPDADRVRRRQG